METINNAAAAVKTAVWGEGNTNTTNTGTGTGNTSSGTSFGTNSEVHKSMIDDSVTETKYSGKRETDPMAADAYDADRDREKYEQRQQERQTSRDPEGPISTGGQPQGANLTNEQNTNKNPMSSSNEPNTGFGGGGAQPSVTADPNSAQQDTTKQQGADRPNEEPDSRSTSSGATGQSGKPAGGMGGGGGMKLPDAENQSKGEGTGTKYEKSTGLNADGGDFDATRPGAAREAQRLMDDSGISHGAGPGAPDTDDTKEKKWFGVDHSGFGGHGSHTNKRGSTSSASGQARRGSDVKNSTNSSVDAYDDTTTTGTTGEKQGLGSKIKDKLHIGSKE